MQPILALLDREHAVTVVEMEAKISDQTYDPAICSDPIDPGHLITARKRLAEDIGVIEPTTSTTKSVSPDGKPDEVTTWSRLPIRGRKTQIERAAERKRALMSRWLSWGHRQLIGKAGEDALAEALAKSVLLGRPSGSTRSILDVEVAEVDNSAVYVDMTDGSMTPVLVMFEVKNTREHYYSGAEEIATFLTKAAIVQNARPDKLILPVFLSRRTSSNLVGAGHGSRFSTGDGDATACQEGPRSQR